MASGRKEIRVDYFGIYLHQTSSEICGMDTQEWVKY
jgi:hypothetical protein